MYLFFSRSDQSRCRFCPGNLFPQFAPCSSMQAIKVILLWPRCSEKPQPAGATFLELVCVVQVGNNLITCFFLSCFKERNNIFQQLKWITFKAFVGLTAASFLFIYGLVLCIKLLFSFHFSSQSTIIIHGQQMSSAVPGRQLILAVKMLLKWLFIHFKTEITLHNWPFCVVKAGPKNKLQDLIWQNNLRFSRKK